MEKENNNCRILHDWAKWEDISITGSEHIYIKQVKRCKRCNKAKGRSVCYVNKVK
jgi:hypothetical protein